MYSLALLFLATVQLLFTAGFPTSYNQVYTPYLDAQCKTEVKSLIDTLGNSSDNVTDLYDYFGVPGIPDASFWNPVFANASSPTSGSASNIWWKVLEQDPGCGVALMTAYSQQTYGRLPFVAASGNVIMFANTPGCYYSEIPVYSHWLRPHSCLKLTRESGRSSALRLFLLRNR